MGTMTTMQQLYLLVPLAPLVGAIVAGLGGRRVGRSGAHWVTIIGVAISFVASVIIYFDVAEGMSTTARCIPGSLPIPTDSK